MSARLTIVIEAHDTKTQTRLRELAEEIQRKVLDGGRPEVFGDYVSVQGMDIRQSLLDSEWTFHTTLV